MRAKEFKPGDLVPSSGVYLIFHSTPHKPLEREMYIRGSRFPECGMCPAGLSYCLEAPYIPFRGAGTPEFAPACC